MFVPDLSRTMLIITNLESTTHYTGNYLDEIYTKVAKVKKRRVFKIPARLLLMFNVDPLANVPSVRNGRFKMPKGSVLFSQNESVVWFETSGSTISA